MSRNRNVSPERAAEQYLKERKPEVAASTHQNHAYALKRFVEWCENENIKNIGTLDNFHVHEFKLYRRENGGVNEVTLYNNLCALRVFIRWCESMGLVEDDIAESIILPNPDDARDTTISPERAQSVLDYLSKFEHASKKHVLFALLWDTGFRLGTARAIDVGDYHSDDGYIEVHHRPETGTPLKNKEHAEREVNLHRWLCEVIDDYVEMHRHDVVDDYDRSPLLTTVHGRAHKTGLREHINGLTRPCYYSGECPHDRELSSCEAAQHRQKAQRCPSSVSPHPIRRSSITAWLNEGHRNELISDRMDVSTKTLDKHYDARTEGEKRELRRAAFDIE